MEWPVEQRLLRGSGHNRRQETASHDLDIQDKERQYDSTFKARLCLDGRRQDPSTYSNISSPTMQMASMRILLALAAHKGWSVYADDAAQAFLNAPRPADQPLYVSYPEGYKNNKKGKCMLLRKMLYGLHDAPMGWFQEVRKHLVNEQGMTHLFAPSSR